MKSITEAFCSTTEFEPEPGPETETETETENTENTENITETENVPLYCNICSWKTHKNSKDKQRGLDYHMKTKHPETKKKKKSNDKKKSNIQLLPPKINEIIDDVEMIGDDEDDKRIKLIGDLDLLRVKFPKIEFTWKYNDNSSIKQLQRQKSLFLRLLNDSAGVSAVFNLLVLSSKAVEKVTDITNLGDLEGYADDVSKNRDEIYPILKDMVDTGQLDCSNLTSEVRLAMIMTSIGVQRLETNRVKKNHFLGEEEDVEN